MTREGGCLCGTVRYSVETGGAIVDYCHCRLCQRASGAPVVAWLQVAPGRFALTAGSTASHASSATCERHFCGRCGSQIFMTDRDGRSVGVTVASLDKPEAVEPATHGWTSSQMPWLVIADDLPRSPGDPPYDAC